LRQLGIYGDGAHGFTYSFDRPLSLLRSYDIVARYANDVACCITWKESADEVLAVKYEDLIVQPENAMARISTLLGLEKAIELNPEREQKVFSGHGTEP
jgi:hypothetical protein